MTTPRLLLSCICLTLRHSRAPGDCFGADVGQGHTGSTCGMDYLQLDSEVPLSPRWNLHLQAPLGRSSNAAFCGRVASFRDPVVTNDPGGIRSFLTLSATL